MRARVVAWGWLVGSFWALVVGSSAWAQGWGMIPSRSLGGYGEATIERYYQNPSGLWVPYGGGFGGFVPYRAIEATRPPIAVPSPRLPIETPIGGESLRAERLGIGARAIQRGYAPLGVGRPWVDRPLVTPSAPSSFGFGSPFRSPSIPGMSGGGMSPASF